MKMRSTFMQSFISHICLYMMIHISQQTCDDSRIEKYGSVTSLNYPNNYDNLRTCFYTINAGTTLIRLVFVDIELEIGYDKVKVFSASGNLLVSLEGRRSWYVLQPSNYYRLEFTSDQLVTRRGFNATWTVAAASIKKSHHGACGYEETSVRMSSSGLTLGHLETFPSDTIVECMYVCSIDALCIAFNFVDKSCSFFLNFNGDNIPGTVSVLM